MDKANLPQEAVTASLKKTQDHIVRVRVLIGQMMKQLAQRALHHDASKLQEVEAIPLAVLEAVSMEHGPAQFGTPEYEERKQILGAMLEHHYAHNSHHPEHWSNGVNGMDLFDLFEMFVDWKAASERGGKDSMRLDVACIRYEVSPQLRDILCNTADRLGWRRD